MYHYTDSGPNNVWLKNGFNILDTPYGRGVSIDDADGLHALLATDLTKKPGRLTGKELRFLRTMLRLSQQSFANMQVVAEQADSLWKKLARCPSQPMQ